MTVNGTMAMKCFAFIRENGIDSFKEFVDAVMTGDDEEMISWVANNYAMVAEYFDSASLAAIAGCLEDVNMRLYDMRETIKWLK